MCVNNDEACLKLTIALCDSVWPFPAVAASVAPLSHLFSLPLSSISPLLISTMPQRRDSDPIDIADLEAALAAVQIDENALLEQMNLDVPIATQRRRTRRMHRCIKCGHKFGSLTKLRKHVKGENHFVGLGGVKERYNKAREAYDQAQEDGNNPPDVLRAKIGKLKRALLDYISLRKILAA